MHLIRLVSCSLPANRVEERSLKPGEELGNCGAWDTECESIIPDDLPSSNHSLVEKVVAEMGEPEGSERKILEKQQQGKVRGESLVCFTLSSYADPTLENDEVSAFPSHSFPGSPCSKSEGWHTHAGPCSEKPRPCPVYGSERHYH